MISTGLQILYVFEGLYIDRLFLQVVLIGHSLAGLTNLQIMEHYPHKVGLAIAISSMVVPSGVKVTEYPPVRDYLVRNTAPPLECLDQTCMHRDDKHNA